MLGCSKTVKSFGGPCNSAAAHGCEVCVASSQPCFFLADATFKTPSGQALQAADGGTGNPWLELSKPWMVLNNLNTRERCVLTIAN